MLKTYAAPANLRDAMRFFSDPDFAHQFFVQLRWPNGVKCIACESDNVAFYASRRVFQCRECRRQFTAKLGTVFEDSAIPLEKWLPALWLLVNAKNGISSYELARALGVTQKTAWFMLGRIRLAMETVGFSKWGGEVEIDEAYIGGLSRFMHKKARKRKILSRGTGGKVAVAGVLRRGPKGKSRIRAAVVPDTTRAQMNAFATTHIVPGAELFTDSSASYLDFKNYFVHQAIDHAVAYAKGRIHTNSLENFWCLLKRAIKGTYVSVDPFHVFRYVGEQVRRYNDRELKDAERFVGLLKDVVGKRLDWKTLTGKSLSPATT